MNLAFNLASGEVAGSPLPGSLRVNRRLAQWLKFHVEGYVEVFSGKVEIGQGILTALAQIAAEELDVSLEQVRMVPASTAMSPDEAITSGSLSVQESGTALRHACAEARAIYLNAAAARLGAPIETLSVDGGRIVSATGGETSYWELVDDDLLDRDATGRVAPKPASAHRIVGAPIARLDLGDKVFGAPCFIHDLELPRMLHGRVLRPPSADATLLDLDEAKVRALPNVVTVVRDGSFVGVLAESEAGADAALKELAAGATWRQGASLPDEASMATWLMAQEAETSIVDSKAAATPRPVARTMNARYSRPYIAHGSIGPSCALAQEQETGLRVWTHSQGIFNLRRDLALALGLAENQVVVQHVQGAGCYGHNGADDVAFDAARLARAAGGRPVRVQWSRADELAWAPFGPAMAVEIEADLDDAGGIVNWRHTIWSNGHTSRPGRAKSPALLGAWHLGKPFERLPAINPPVAGGGGADRNSIPLYTFPAWQIVNHWIMAMPLRASALRSLGAYANVFAIESFIDEVAGTAGVDPVAFRLRYLDDPRARAVIECAARNAGWDRWEKREGAGHGIGFARIQERQRVLRGGCRDRSGSRDPRAPTGDRGRRGSGHQSRRCGESDRGRRDPGDELDAQGSGALRSLAGDQRQLAGLPDPALLGGAGGRGRDRVAPGLSGGGRRRSGAGPDGGGDRECGVRCTRRPGARAAADGRANSRRDGVKRGQ